jgi:spore maturation protein SpmA
VATPDEFTVATLNASSVQVLPVTVVRLSDSARRLAPQTTDPFAGKGVSSLMVRANWMVPVVAGVVASGTSRTMGWKMPVSGSW